VDESDLRLAIRLALETLNPAVEATLRRELAVPIDLGHSDRIQFEVCPYFHGIHLIQTEEEILPDSAAQDCLPQELQDAAEAADLDLHTALGEELLPWFADRWEQVGGPALYRPAYAFFHGGLDEPRYDLERRLWLSVEEVFGE
jgi:hypothetical protein